MLIQQALTSANGVDFGCDWRIINAIQNLQAFGSDLLITVLQLVLQDRYRGDHLRASETSSRHSKSAGYPFVTVHEVRWRVDSTMDDGVEVDRGHYKINMRRNVGGKVVRFTS
jgi:hypothetical protein